MPKIIYKCIDCGKENLYYPSSIPTPISEYRCKRCRITSHNLNQKKKKVTYKCVDCGKERTSSKSHFKKSKDDYRCKRCASKKRRVSKVTYKCIDCGKSRTAYKWEFKVLEKNYRCKKCAIQKTTQSPEWQEANKVGAQNRKEDPLWLKSIKLGATKRSENPHWQKMMKKRNQKLTSDINWKSKQKEGALKSSSNPIYRENLLISLTGQDFWYGHPIINTNPPKYCEIFEEVKPRVRAFFNHTCTKCGELETSKSFNVHHVFYEKKTCCWVDDGGHYWTNLNIKSHSQDYYIGENPNYFALLCDSCHGTTNGKYENRKKSADELKKLIDEKFGGKSYLTKEEYEIYKNK